MKSRAGPNPNRSVAQGLPPSSIGSALISTPLSIKRLPTGVDEGGQRGREGPHRLWGAGSRAAPLGLPFARCSPSLAVGRRSFLARRRVGDRRLEAARDGLAPAVDRLDVALPDLLLKQGIGHGDRRFRARHEEPHQQEVREQDEHEPEPGSCPAASSPARYPSRLQARCRPAGPARPVRSRCCVARRAEGVLLPPPPSPPDHTERHPPPRNSQPPNPLITQKPQNQPTAP